MSRSASSPPAPVVLIIRDGWGQNPHPEHDAFNAVKLADTPVDDALRRDWPHTLIRTSGEDVGLPAGTMGNSEVGHQNIGAGRIVDQEIMRITRAIRDGSFFQKDALRAAFDHARDTGGCVHFVGLVSDGKVHSDIQHLFALIDMAGQLEFPGERVFIHAFTDGRDVGPTTGLGFVKQLQQKLASWQEGEASRPRIASVCGRYYAMDRDDRWDRIARAYQCIAGCDVAHPGLENMPAPRDARSAAEAVQAYYDCPSEPSRTGDEFITPTRIVHDSTAPETVGRVTEGDAVVFFNFRGDRPRELTKAFVLDDEAWANVKGGGFDRGERIRNLYFCTMTGYEEGLPVSAVAFDKPPKLKHILGDVVSRAGRTQFRCAETEKFAHVTFFFNDYREQPFDGESRLLVPSPREVTTYDQKPEMSAPQVCDGVLERLRADDCQPLIVVNFANPDMVGHTGHLQAAIKAVETVDECVGRIIEALRERGGSAIVTADHGNAEQMWDPAHDGPHTAHTAYDVPLIVVSEPARGTTLRAGGRLADIAPTVLDLMGLSQLDQSSRPRRPEEMTGQSLLARASVAV